MIEQDLSLWQASYNGDIARVEVLLNGGMNVNSTSEEGLTPLICASLNGQLELVKLLMERGANIYMVTPTIPPGVKGRYAKIVTSLENASECSDIEIKELGITALDAAAQYGHLEVVRLLLDVGGSNIDLGIDFKPIFASSQSGHIEVVKLLLSRGASIDLINNEFTCLNVAAKNGHLEVVRLLLDQGASIDLIPLGFSSVYLACNSGHIEVVRMLLDRGANSDLASNHEFTTPLLCATINGYLGIVKLLAERGANVNFKDYRKRDAISFASFKGYFGIVKILIERGSCIDSADEDGITPLMYASLKGHVKVVKLLLKHGAFPDHTDIETEFPMLVASRRDQVECVRLLLENGASVNKMDVREITALSAAAKRGYLEIVKLLMKYRADTNVGQSALELAAKRDHVEVVTFLVSCGAPWKASAYKAAMEMGVRFDLLDLCEVILQLHSEASNSVAIITAAESVLPQSFAILKLFINGGANLDKIALNTKSGLELTALLLAVKSKQPLKVWELTLHGADTTIPQVAVATKEQKSACFVRETRQFMMPYCTSGPLKPTNSILLGSELQL